MAQKYKCRKCKGIIEFNKETALIFCNTCWVWWNPKELKKHNEKSANNKSDKN